MNQDPKLEEERTRESASTEQEQSSASSTQNNRAPSFSLPTIEGTVEPRLSLYPPQPTVSEEERQARIREISNLPVNFVLLYKERFG